MSAKSISRITHSVLCVTYNQEDYIEKAITSLFEGKVWPDEVIILDDFSTDGTRKIISGLACRYPDNVRLIFNPKNLGVYGNFNQLLGLASCDMVHLCSGDDWIESGMFERMNEEIKLRGLNPKVDSFLMMPNGYIFRDDKLELQSNTGKRIESLFKSTLRESIWYMWVGMSRVYYDSFPKFDETLGIWADYHHALNFSLRCEELYILHESFPVYRAGIGISTRTASRDQSKSFLRVVDKISVDLRLYMDASDIKFLNYQRKKHEAVVNPGLVQLLCLFWSYLINAFNGAKILDLRIVIGEYLKKYRVQDV